MPKKRGHSNSRPTKKTVRKASKLLRSKRSSAAVKSVAGAVMRDAKPHRGKAAKKKR